MNSAMKQDSGCCRESPVGAGEVGRKCHRTIWHFSALCARNSCLRTGFTQVTAEIMVNCKHRQFKPAEDTNLVENSREVMLYRVFADFVSKGDVTITLAVHNCGDDFDLSRREPKFPAAWFGKRNSLVRFFNGLRLPRLWSDSRFFRGLAIAGLTGRTLLCRHRAQCVYKMADGFATDPQLLIHDTPDAFAENFRPHVLPDDASRAELQCLNDIGFGNGCSQHDCANGIETRDLTQDVETGQAWHGDIEQQNVGETLLCHCHGFCAVRSLSDNVEVFIHF